MAMPLAKGTAFMHDEEYVRQTYGPDAWTRVLAAMPPADVEVRSSVVAIGWYENALLIRTLLAIDEVLRDRDPNIIEALGRYAAEADLTRIHRVFLRMANPAFVVEKATELWGRFFDTGHWEVKRVERGADAALIGAGVVHEVFCRNLASYLHRLFELVGAKAVTTRHTECRVRGDARCTYVIRWR
jgi:predicted hydrocarbon binding protein